MIDKKYPFREDWPVEGFSIDSSGFVQIRVKSVLQAKPPYKGYPPANKTGAYQWWEVHVCFQTSKRSDKATCIIRGKSGRVLKERRESRCIARFETKEEADFFVHKMHQSKEKENFFVKLT